MLEHSRKSSAEKTPTDINELADEYLRLSYHGLRAKDKSFNAEFKTDLDPNLPKINVVTQDIARVLLNLCNNAFHATAEKKRTEAGVRNITGRPALISDLPSSSSDLPYSPLVSVFTKIIDEKVEIRITDNGPGIPDSIKNKIFQPFFTTKPTGQGIGLGLSLAYDIVKAHGGELKVESREGLGSEFVIQLPV